MSKVLKFVGTIAGIVAAGALIISTGGIAGAAAAATLGTVAGAATAVSLAANIGANLTAKKPPGYIGSPADIRIGADHPAPLMIGDTYCGGIMVHQVGYGPTVNDVPNTYLFMANVYSVGGPIESIDTYYADFDPIAWNAPSGGVRNASGYFNNFMYENHQLGGRPESAALITPSGWGTPTGWGTAYKLSGKAAVGWSLKWDSKSGKYASGAPQLGIQGKGVKWWDPRDDDTYPGGAGDQRWADPRTDKSGHDDAWPTWLYSDNPGIVALGLALGRWERNESDGDSEYQLTFGVGIPQDGIVIDDFIDLANLCDENEWTVNGLLWEPGDKWANLKRVLETGGADPCFKGGKLGLKLSAPRVSLDTITRDDIAEGELKVPGCLPWRDRFNTVLPKCMSPAHKWQLQQSAIELTSSTFVAEDGEVKREEMPFELVTDFTQCAQLAAYKLFDAREAGPITLSLGPRFRFYSGGDMLTVDADLAAYLGLTTTTLVMLSRELDPATMTVTANFVTEDAAKHTAALAATGSAPDSISIPTTEDLDSIVNGSYLGGFRATEVVVSDDTGGTAEIAYIAPVSAGWTHTQVWYSATDDFDTATDGTGDQAFAGLGAPTVAFITGLTPGTYYFWVVTFDDTTQLTRTTSSVSQTIT